LWQVLGIFNKGEDMDDRKLLELAARAAGVEWLGFEDEYYFHEQTDYDWKHEDHGRIGVIISSKPCEQNIWNPLTDDGDALRLAVKLGIALDRTSNRCWTWVNGWSYPGALEEFYKDDPYAATRRAIVRAAAAIGEQMP
jgi:hypothetical protein